MKGTIIEQAHAGTPDRAAIYAAFQIRAYEDQKAKIRAEIKAKVREGNSLITEINAEIKKLKQAVPR